VPVLKPRAMGGEHRLGDGRNNRSYGVSDVADGRNRGDHRRRDGLGVERTVGSAPADPAPTTGRRTLGDRPAGSAGQPGKSRLISLRTGRRMPSRVHPALFVSYLAAATRILIRCHPCPAVCSAPSSTSAERAPTPRGRPTHSVALSGSR
jgi:hypothetical protein